MQTTTQTTPPAPQRPARPSKPRAPAPMPPPEFQSDKVDAMNEPDLIKLLKDSGATTFQKAKACQRLATIGTKAAVPALAALLADTQLSTYARYGLQPIPDASADDALREALPKLKGTLLVGVINSIAYRKDAKSVAALTKLLSDSDASVAQASAAALGHIGTPEAAKSLQGALSRTKGQVRTAVADGGLICAERLLAQGERAQALTMYNTLTATDVPKPVRLAAMHGIIGAETSLSRPR